MKLHKVLQHKISRGRSARIHFLVRAEEIREQTKERIQETREDKNKGLLANEIYLFASGLPEDLVAKGPPLPIYFFELLTDNSLGNPESPSNSQKKGQENQGNLRQLEGGPALALSPLCGPSSRPSFWLLPGLPGTM